MPRDGTRAEERRDDRPRGRIVKARPDSRGFTTAHAARISLATRRKNRPRGEVLHYAYPTQIEAMGHEHHGHLYNWCTPDEELPEGAEILERVNT